MSCIALEPTPFRICLDDASTRGSQLGQTGAQVCLRPFVLERETRLGITHTLVTRR